MRFATRRMICRVAFVVLCVVPTVLSGGLAWLVHAPLYQAWYKSRWETALSTALGVDVAVRRIVRERGGRTVLFGVRLRNPEQQEPVATVRSIEIVSGAEWVVELNQCAVARPAAAWLARRLHEHVFVSAHSLVGIHVHARNLIFTSNAAPVCLLDLNCRLRCDKAGREALIDFKMPDQANATSIRLRVVRNRQLDPPATGWELHTGTTPVPCEVAVSWLPGVARLGGDCEFAGSIWAESTRSGWNVQLDGTFRDADLDRLVTDSFPHKLTGAATIHIEHSVVRSGRLVALTGTIETEGGVVSASLLRAASAALQLHQRKQTGTAMLLRYDKFGLKFALDAKNLTVEGIANARGAVMIDEAGVLLAVEQKHTVSPLALVRLLVPDNQLMVPATKETATLVRILPLPEIVPSDTSSARAAYAPLRLRR